MLLARRLCPRPSPTPPQERARAQELRTGLLEEYRAVQRSAAELEARFRGGFFLGSIFPTAFRVSAFRNIVLCAARFFLPHLRAHTVFSSLRRLAQRRVGEVTAANRARIADTELMDARGQLQSARADLLQTSEDLAQARTLAARDSRAAGSVPEGR